MSCTRAEKRRAVKTYQPHLNVLATLLGTFYEFLASVPQPSDNEVREKFTSSDKQWKDYCLSHQLMNANHLFVLNVREAWKKHASQPLPTRQQ